jgi:hypothetical protein
MALFFGEKEQLFLNFAHDKKALFQKEKGFCIQLNQQLS